MKKNIKYADLSARHDKANLKFNDFTLSPPTNTYISVYQSGHKASCPPGYHTKLNAYDHYIIHYILTGCGTYFTPSASYSVAKGEMFLIRPSESVHYQADYSMPWTYYWVGFNGTQVPKILNQCGFSDSILTRSYHCDDQLKKIMHKLAYPQCNGISREYELLGNLYHMFSLLNNAYAPEPLSKSAQYINSAIEFIYTNYSYSDLKVSDVANYVGIERSYLYRIFYEHLHMSVQNFILELRLKKAQNLLQYSDTPIGVIAFNCGFDNQSYFSTIFKRKFHLSPMQYRKTTP